MSASAAVLDCGNLKVKTRLVSSGAISYIYTDQEEPRPQERIVNSLRQRLVAAGVAHYKNVRKVMKPFRNFFVLLKIRFDREVVREEAQNKTLMGLATVDGTLVAPEAPAKHIGKSSGKPPYRNRRYDIAKFGRR